MKSFILIAVLAALTVCSNGAFIDDDVAIFQEESISRQGEILLYDRPVFLDPFQNAVKVWDLEFNGGANTTITGIRVLFPPPNGISNAGPLGSSQTQVKLVTPPGGRISSRIQIFGRV